MTMVAMTMTATRRARISPARPDARLTIDAPTSQPSAPVTEFAVKINPETARAAMADICSR